MLVGENTDISDKYHFYHMNDEACGISIGVTSFPGIALFRKFDTSPLFYSPDLSESWRPALLLGWMQAAAVPQLIEFSEEYIEPIFTHRRQAIILFRDNDEAKTAEY